MKVTEIKKSEPKSVRFGAIAAGEAFLSRNGELHIKLGNEMALNLFSGNLVLQAAIHSDELVGVVEAEVRYSEVRKQEEPEEAFDRKEDLRLAACKRALLEMRNLDLDGIVSNSLLTMLEEAIKD